MCDQTSTRSGPLLSISPEQGVIWNTVNNSLTAVCDALRYSFVRYSVMSGEFQSTAPINLRRTTP